MLTNNIWSRFEIVNILYKNTDMFIYIRIKIKVSQSLAKKTYSFYQPLMRFQSCTNIKYMVRFYTILIKRVVSRYSTRFKKIYNI